MLFGRPLDVIGILKKNGIMLVDFALQGERERGLSSEDAIHEARLLRFRPTLTTTLCALLGGVPPYQRPNGLIQAASLIDPCAADGHPSYAIHAVGWVQPINN